MICQELHQRQKIRSILLEFLHRIVESIRVAIKATYSISKSMEQLKRKFEFKQDEEFYNSLINVKGNRLAENTLTIVKENCYISVRDCLCPHFYPCASQLYIYNRTLVHPPHQSD